MGISTKGRTLVISLLTLNAVMASSFTIIGRKTKPHNSPGINRLIIKPGKNHSNPERRSAHSIDTGTLSTKSEITPIVNVIK
ncbi:MAG TPA: hypothetical protein VK783_03535 [Bacteroidia bacterium]|nr:hypothetical protein [Bacteroidia bacterium]